MLVRPVVMPVAQAVPRLPTQAGAGGGAFVPNAAFFAGRQGFALDYSDSSKLFQLSNGTTAVSSDGDPIGYATDISGNARHATQATAGFRPLWRPSVPGGEWEVTDDLMLTPSVNLSAVDKLTVVVSIRNASNAGTQIIADFASSGAGSGQVRLVSGKLNGQLTGSTGTSAVSETAAAPAVPVNRVVAVVLDLAGVAAGDEVKLYENGTLVGGTVTSAGPAGAGNFQNATVGIGALRNGLFPLNGSSIVRLIAIEGVLSAGDFTNANAWCADPLA